MDQIKIKYSSTALITKLIKYGVGLSPAPFSFIPSEIISTLQNVN